MAIKPYIHSTLLNIQLSLTSDSTPYAPISNKMVMLKSVGCSSLSPRDCPHVFHLK